MSPSSNDAGSQANDATVRYVLRALTDALERGEPVRRESVLHDAVRDRSRSLRARGVPAQHVWADMKRLIRQAIRTDCPNDVANEERRLLGVVILAPVPGWSVEEYFRKGA